MSAEQAHSGGEVVSHGPALQTTTTTQNLNVATPAGAEIRCVRVLYGRCSPLGVTELLVKRAKQEAPGVKLALLRVWRTLMSSLKADVRSLEPLWVDAGLDPDVAPTPEDFTKADAAAEEALAPCRICVVDLATFLNSVVRRAVLVAKPNGDLLLALELEHSGQHAFVATKLTAWMRRTKEGEKYAIPPMLQANLHSIGVEIDADPHDLLVELLRRAQRYNTVPDAYLRPLLLQVVEKLKTSPHLARCSRNRRIIYIAAELVKTAAWFFDANIGLGRNQLYAVLNRYGLLEAPTTVPVDLHDEFGRKVKKRALPFYIDRLAEFVEYDLSLICNAAAGLAPDEEGPLAGGEEQQTDRDDV